MMLHKEDSENVSICDSYIYAKVGNVYLAFLLMSSNTISTVSVDHFDQQHPHF